MREKQEAAHEIDKSTRLLFVSNSFISLSLSLSLSLSRNMHFLVFFSFSSLSSASAIVEIDELPGAGLAALQQRSHLGSRSAGDPCSLKAVMSTSVLKHAIPRPVDSSANLLLLFMSISSCCYFSVFSSVCSSVKKKKKKSGVRQEKETETS